VLLEDERTLIGIDHGFPFPVACFSKHQLPLDWTAFLEDFRPDWPTDAGNGNA
jgi:hypothetical protein